MSLRTEQSRTAVVLERDTPRVVGSLMELAASDPALRMIDVVGAGVRAQYFFEEGDFSALANDENVIKVGGGAWLRSGTRALVYVNSSATASGVQNRAAWVAALAAVEVGGRVVDPLGNGRYPIDTSDGPILITRYCTIQQDGHWYASTHTYSSAYARPAGQPFCVFASIGVPFVLKGTGTVSGSLNGETNDINEGDIRTHPTLYYLKQVTGAVLVSPTLTIETPYKTAIALDRCVGCTISLKWRGGPFPYGDTAYFGIEGDGGGRHKIVGNVIEAGANGGRFTNWFFAGTFYGYCSDNRIDDNSFVVWEKLAYLYGPRQTLTNNRGRGLITDVIRLDNADGSKVSGLDIQDNSAGAVSIYDGSDITVENVTATGLRQICIYISRSVNVSYVNGFNNIRLSNIKASGNPLGATFTASVSNGIMTVTSVTNGKIVEGRFLQGTGLPVLPDPLLRIVATGTVNPDGTGTYHVKPKNISIPSTTITTLNELSSGIRLLAKGSDANGLNISAVNLDNFALSSGAGVIDISAETPAAVRRAIISDVTASSSVQRALILGRVTDSSISGVAFSGAGPRAVQEANCARNRIVGIDAPNVTAAGVEGLAATSSTDNNKFDAVSLRGSVTLSSASGVTTIVGKYAPEAWVSLSPTNSAAAAWVDAQGPLIWAISGGNITITTRSGASPTGAETFKYDVRN